MKRLVAFLLALAATIVPARAQYQQGQPLSALPQATLPLSGNELLYVFQKGVSKQAPVSGFIASVPFPTTGDGAPVYPETYGPAGQVHDALIFGDGQFTSGQTTFSSATASFSPADVGKVVNWRRGLNSTADFTTTFKSFVDAHDMTLVAAPSASSTFHCTAATVTTPEGSGSYVPGDTVSVSGGAETSVCSFTVAETQVVAATVNAGGSGGTTGACTVTGTTGAGTFVQAVGTVSGGALTGPLTIQTIGPFWTNPTSLTAEPVTGCGLTGATLTLTMGIYSLTQTAGGSYTALPATATFSPLLQTVSTTPTVTTGGSGSGATINVLWEGETFVYGHDATAAMQAAVAALPASGGTVQLLNGGYLISGSLTMPSNSSIVGAPQSTIFISGPSAWGFSNKVGPAIINAAGAENLTVQDIQFSYPHSFGCCHAIQFGYPNVGASHVTVRHITADGGGDLTAMIGVSDALITDSIATNEANSCYDNWDGSDNIRVIGNYCATWPSAGGSVGAIQFTGINNAAGPATTVGFTAIGNQIHVQNGSAPQGIIINGPATGIGESRRIIVSGNHIVVDYGQNSWGVLVTGIAKDCNVSNNMFEGNNGTLSAVYINTAVIGCTVSHNVAFNWNSGSNGIFNNQGTGGTVDFNEAYGSSSPLLGTISSTVMSWANDTGTGRAVGNMVILGTNNTCSSLTHPIQFRNLLSSPFSLDVDQFSDARLCLGAFTELELTPYGPILGQTYAVASLPVSPTQGTRAFVNDEHDLCAFWVQPTGGGPYFCPVVYDGGNWKIE